MQKQSIKQKQKLRKDNYSLCYASHSTSWMGCFINTQAMKKVFTLMAIVFCIACSAQRSNTKQDSTEKTKFKLSVNYNSNLNYYGRTDSLKSTGVFPLAELWFTPKVYVSAAPIF